MLIVFDDKDSGKTIKICQIVAYKNGGFAIMSHYHDSSTGIMIKYKAAYDDDREYSMVPESGRFYYTNHEVKLSYHQDGFVQFSGVKNGEVISGIQEGQIKGLGVMAPPLDLPRNIGPLFIIGFWGLDRFTELKSSEKDIFRLSSDSAKDNTDKALKEASALEGYAIEVFVLSALASQENVIRSGENKYAHMSIMRGTPVKPGGVRRREALRILEFPGQTFILGFLLSRVSYPFNVDSGMHILGPTDGTHGLLVEYHNAISADDIQSSQSLDYFVNQ